MSEHELARLTMESEVFGFCCAFWSIILANLASQTLKLITCLPLFSTNFRYFLELWMLGDTINYRTKGCQMFFLSWVIMVDNSTTKRIQEIKIAVRQTSRYSLCNTSGRSKAQKINKQLSIQIFSSVQGLIGPNTQSHVCLICIFHKSLTNSVKIAAVPFTVYTARWNATAKE